jgi:hypothetical protein
MKEITHLEFRKDLYRELFRQGSEESLLKKRRYSSVQPLDEGDDQIEKIPPRKWCHICFMQVQRQGPRSYCSKTISDSLLL